MFKRDEIVTEAKRSEIISKARYHAWMMRQARLDLIFELAESNNLSEATVEEIFDDEIASVGD